MISQGSGVETAPNQKETLRLKIIYHTWLNIQYITLNNTNLLIGLLYAGKMSLLYIQQYFLYDKIRKNA